MTNNSLHLPRINVAGFADNLDDIALPLVRWFVAVGVSVRFAFHRTEFLPNFWNLIVALLVTLFVYTGIVTWLYFRTPKSLRRNRFATIQIALDLVIYTTLYYVSGDIGSDLFLLYFLPLLVAAEQIHLQPAIRIFLLYILVIFCLSIVVLALPPHVQPLTRLTKVVFPRAGFYLVILFLVSVRNYRLRNNENKLALQNIQLTKRQDELQKLREIEQEINHNFNHPDILQIIMDHIRSFFEAEGVHVRLLRNGILELVSSSGEYSHFLDVIDKIGSDDNETKPLFIECFESGQPKFQQHAINDVSFHAVLVRAEAEDAVAYQLLKKVRSLGCFPLKIGDIKLGVLSITFSQQEYFSTELKLKLEDFARRISIVLRNIELSSQRERQKQQIQKQKHELETIQDFAVKLVSYKSSDLKNLLHEIAEEAAKILNVTGTLIYLVTQNEQYFEAITSVGLGINKDDLVRIGINEGMAGKVRKTRKFLIEEDYSVSPFRIDTLGHYFDHTSVLEVPLVIADKFFGVIVVASDKNTNRPFSVDVDVPVLERFAQLVSLILHYNQLITIEQLLRNLAVAVNSSLDTRLVARTFLEGVKEIIYFDSATVQILQSGKLVVQDCEGFDDPKKIIGLPFEIDDPELPNYLVMRSTNPIDFDDIRRQYPRFADAPDGSEICSWMGVPIITNGRRYGMITLDRRNQIKPFADKDIELARIFVNMVAVGLSNSVQHEQMMILHSLSVSLGRARRLDILADNLLSALGDLLVFDRATIQLISSNERKLLKSQDINLTFPTILKSLPDDKLVSKIVDQDEVCIISDTRSEQAASLGWEIRPETMDVYSWIGIPIRNNSMPLIFITVDHRTKSYFDDSLKPLLTLFSSIASVALENAGLITELQDNVAKLNEAYSLAMVGLFFGEDIHLTSNRLSAARTHAHFISRHPEETELVAKKALRIESNVQAVINIRKAIQDLPTDAQLEELSINAILNDVIATIDISDKVKVVWSDRLKSKQWVVRGYKKQLGQVFRVIIYNANVAMAGIGELTLDIKVQSHALNRRELFIVSIRDTGTGILETDKKYMFEIRSAKSRRNSSGTGFGLAWARLFMRWYGGDIDFETKSQIGTTMFVHIPRNFAPTSKS